MNLARATVRGTFWSYSAYYGGKMMVFLSTIILARLLTKEDFGVAGYALTVIALLDVVSDLGVGPALIYHRDDPEAAPTAFWLGLGIGIALFAVTWFLAPLAGVFFNDNRAIPVTRALALTYPISALGNVHDMLMRKKLAFGRKFIPDFIRASSKGVFSILLALLGMGPWSLILGQVGGTAISVIAFWWVEPWRPSVRVARALARPLLSYGASYVSIDAISVVVENIDYLFVGHFLSTVALGVYSLAFRIPEILILQFCSIISRVIFPVYTKMREDPQALSRGFLVATRYIVLVTAPLGLGLALTAEPFVLTFLTDKWIEAIPVIRAISIYALILSLSWNAGDVYKAQGHLMLLTGLTVLEGAILIPLLWWSVTRIGTIAAVGWTHAIVAFLRGMIELAVALRMLHTPIRMLVDVFRPAAIGGIVMTVTVLGTQAFLANTPPSMQLVASVAVGALAYVGSLWLLQRDLVMEASRTVGTAFIQR